MRSKSTRSDLIVTRRKFMVTATGLALTPLISSVTFASESLQDSLEKSSLVYISPVLSNGNLSKCQAEVWFVSDKNSVYVVTASDTWRAQAISKGLNKAKIWVGDVGVWTDSDDKYKQLPSSFANSDRIMDTAKHEAVLEMFGSKYYLQWVRWGSKFRNGLKDGSRVMLRYEVV